MRRPLDFDQNLVPGAARRLGLDAETLRANRPSLIHCSISGYGEGGPYATKKGALEAAGIASARLRAPADLAGHPQLPARDRWRTVGTPGGAIEALLPPVEVAGGDPVMGPVPALGEHTAAVRAEFGQTESGKEAPA